MQELERVDQRELNQRVKYVRELSKEIPFYVRKYKELGIDPDEIRSPQDLMKAYEKGLYTTPEDLPQLLTPSKVFRQYFLTSGTSGKPKIVSITPDERERLIRQYTNAWINFIRERDTVMTYLPASPAISGITVTESFSRLPIKVFHLPVQFARDVNTFMQYYNLFKPTSIMGLTSSIYRLPLSLRENSIEPKNLKIRVIGTGAEPSTVARRKTIGEEFGADVYDFYASSENGLIAYESQPFSGEYTVTLPETLLSIVKDKEEVSVGETGDVLLTNLYKTGERSSILFLNYKIGDWAKCLEKNDDGIVTSISEIRREAAYLAGAKLNPQEVERCIEKLENYKKELTGEYTLIDFNTVPREVVQKLIKQGIELDEDLLEKLRNDPKTYKNWDRKSEAEIRVESRKILHPGEKEKIRESVREIVYSSNIPVKTLVEDIRDARLFIEVEDPGELYKGFRKLIKPGKPKRLIEL